MHAVWSVMAWQPHIGVCSFSSHFCIDDTNRVCKKISSQTLPPTATHCAQFVFGTFVCCILCHNLNQNATNSHLLMSFDWQHLLHVCLSLEHWGVRHCRTHAGGWAHPPSGTLLTMPKSPETKQSFKLSLKNRGQFQNVRWTLLWLRAQFWNSPLLDEFHALP